MSRAVILESLLAARLKLPSKFQVIIAYKFLTFLLKIFVTIILLLAELKAGKSYMLSIIFSLAIKIFGISRNSEPSY